MLMKTLFRGWAGALILLPGLVAAAAAGVVSEGRAGDKYVYRVNGVTVVLSEGDAIDGCTVTRKGLVCSEEQLAENAPGGKVITDFADAKRSWEECEEKLKAASALIAEKDQALSSRERELLDLTEKSRKSGAELAELQQALREKEKDLELSRKAASDGTPRRLSEQSLKTEEKMHVAGDYPQASTRLLTESELRGRDSRDLRMIRNEIFARHSYRFKTRELREHFAGQPWYSARHDDVTAMLTEIERANVTLLDRLEKAGKITSPPGADK